jgi:hypothetical protein
MSTEMGEYLCRISIPAAKKPCSIRHVPAVLIGMILLGRSLGLTERGHAVSALGSRQRPRINPEARAGERWESQVVLALCTLIKKCLYIQEQSLFSKKSLAIYWQLTQMKMSTFLNKGAFSNKCNLGMKI